MLKSNELPIGTINYSELGITICKLNKILQKFVYNVIRRLSIAAKFVHNVTTKLKFQAAFGNFQLPIMQEHIF